MLKGFYQRSRTGVFVLVCLLLSAWPALADLQPCLVCSTEQGRIHKEECSITESFDGAEYYFCQSHCHKAFEEDPETWVARFQALQESESNKTQIAEGDSLPRFRLPMEPIGSISTEDLLGKVVLLNGWASWCAPCMEEMPDLVKLQKEFKDSGLVVIALSFDKTKEKHRSTVEELDLNFPSIYADQPEVQEFLKSLGEFESIPFTLVVDQEGKLVKRLDQAANYKEFKEIVEPLFEPEDEPEEEANRGSVVPS
jgi:peroxiredoxin/YHS domain-containing protein